MSEVLEVRGFLLCVVYSSQLGQGVERFSGVEGVGFGVGGTRPKHRCAARWWALSVLKMPPTISLPHQGYGFSVRA